MTEKRIENVINKKLAGDARKNALDFVSFLYANDIALDYNADESDNWGVWCGAVGGIVGNSIGYLSITGHENAPGPWTFWFNVSDFDGSDSADDEFKNAMWAFASPCGRCGEGWETCMSAKKTILGKEFENQCHSPLMFCNPDAKILENMKKFLLYLKPEINDIQTRIKQE